MKDIGVGLIGFGTVGAGVVETLQMNGDLVAKRTGARLILRKIADLDLASDRGVKVDSSLLTNDAHAVVSDPDIDIVVELIGGTDVACDLILSALEAKKPVVTANKALLAERGDEIFAAAKKNNTDVCFEAAVCGGMPIVRALSRGLVANKIESIRGILNGTCNYILTQMSAEDVAFDDALASAQEAGYAEADPGLDIDGHDSAHKATILASLAYGLGVPVSAVHVRGIRGLAREEIRYAKDLGYVVKLLAVIKRHEDGGKIEAHVSPTLVPSGHMLASVGGVFNAVQVRGDVSGETLYYGIGAGRRATASAVVSDLTEVARKLAFGSQDSLMPVMAQEGGGEFLDAGKIEARCYLRLSLLDSPGVLGKICDVLGGNGVSLASVLQKEIGGEYVPVVIVTHAAPEKNFESAIHEIDSMDIVGGPTVRLRIEDCECH